MEPENLRADLERIEKRLSEVRKGRSNILRALASGLADLDSDSTKLLNELRERERRLEARRREIEAALLRSAADESRIKDVCRRAKEYLGMLDTLSFDQKRALVRTLVRQVTVSGGGGDFQVTVYAAFAPAAAAVAVEKGRK